MRFLVPLLAAACVSVAADLDIGLTAGPSFPVGSWGQYIGSGLSARACVQWKPLARIGAGAALGAGIYGDEYEGDASLLMITPEIVSSFHLRPWGRSFNPGIEAGFGMTRSSLRSGGGTDPATWDPSWRAGFRWDFSLGSGYRAAVGFDFAGILGSRGSSDSFGLVFRISRGVQL